MNKRLITSIVTVCMFVSIASAATSIFGTNQATADRMYAYVKSQNSSFDREISDAFYELSQIYGIRGDIALCQSIIETGWFKYTGGTAVTAEDHNYCGLGVTTLGIKGCQFETVEDGVHAQLQHLWAYATTESLPSNVTLIDPRFKYVSRGVAPTWEALSGRWSTQSNYGEAILDMFDKMMAFQMEEASLTASTTNVTLSAIAGETSSSYNVTIKGTNLSSPIVYNSNMTVFKVTTSNWNDYTGGTMTITLDTSKSAGTYNGYVAVQSGSGTNLRRIEINCTGTITASSTIPGETPALSFTEGWNLSQSKGNATSEDFDATLVRNFAYQDGKLYCIYNHSTIKVINARTGEYIKDLNNGTVVSGGTLALCDVQCLNGRIIACNLGSATSGLKVYSWENDDAIAELLMTSTDLQGATRIGDCMTISGIWGSNLCLTFGNDDNTTTRIIEYKYNGSTWTASSKNVTSDGSNHLVVGSSMRVIPDNGGYWIDGKGILPTYVNATGVKQSALAGESCTYGNAFDIFNYDGISYMFVATYLNKTNTYTEGLMRLYNCSEGWASATAVADYPSVGLGSSRNTNTTGGVIVNSGTDYVEAWILTTTQGLAYYKSGNVPNNEVVTPTPSLSVSTNALSFNTIVGTPISKSVTISGSNLTGDISLSITGSGAPNYSLSSSVISKSQASATITITYNPTNASDADNATLTVATSSATSVSISLAGQATNPTVEVKLPTKFTTDWCYSAANGTSTSWMNPGSDYTRNMVLNENKLYVVQRDVDNGTGYIKIVDAYTGVEIGTLSSTGITSDAYQFASVANIGGTIIACNLAYGATSTLKVYSWNDDDATPEIVMETTTHGGRAGDLMSASGTIENGKLYFASNTGYEGLIYVYTVTNGKANTTPEVITLKDTNGDTYDLGGTAAVIEIKANEDGTFWATGKAGAPALFNAKGELIRQLALISLDGNMYGTSYCPISFGEYNLAVAATYTTGVQQGYLNLIDVTAGEASATKLYSYPTLGSSNVSNGTYVTSALAKADGNKIHLWTLIPKQGVAKYTATSELSIVEDVLSQDINIVVKQGCITVENAEVENFMLVSLTGAIVANNFDNELSTAHIPSGLYVAVAILQDGRKIVNKVIVR